MNWLLESINALTNFVTILIVYIAVWFADVGIAMFTERKYKDERKNSNKVIKEMWDRL